MMVYSASIACPAALENFRYATYFLTRGMRFIVIAFTWR
jgi:hypothetical protein